MFRCMLDLAAAIRDASTAEARFACIERLTLQWHGRAPKGCSRRQIGAAVRRLGVSVPEVVQRWYEKFALTEGIAYGQNFVVAPRDWALVGAGLAVGVENQDNWVFAVGLDGEDPPVHVEGSERGR